MKSAMRMSARFPVFCVAIGTALLLWFAGCSKSKPASPTTKPAGAASQAATSQATSQKAPVDANVVAAEQERRLRSMLPAGWTLTTEGSTISMTNGKPLETYRTADMAALKAKDEEKAKDEQKAREELKAQGRVTAVPYTIHIAFWPPMEANEVARLEKRNGAACLLKALVALTGDDGIYAKLLKDLGPVQPAPDVKMDGYAARVLDNAFDVDRAFFDETDEHLCHFVLMGVRGGLKTSASEPIYPMWDGKETPTEYARRAGIKELELVLPLDANGGVTIKLALIPPGTFKMGSPPTEKGRLENEGPQRTVTILRPFYLGECLVTQEQYRKIMGKGPSAFPAEGGPVDTVSWLDANDFCAALSATTGRKVTLPTEAQWEYACRAGTKTRFFFGDDEAKLGDYAWFSANSGDKPHPVGQKKAHPWGLYDMGGNLWEWCSDWYGKDYYGKAAKVDPKGPDSGAGRVLRGGNWHYDADYCRSASRYWIDAASRYKYYGFRVAMEVK